MAGKKYISPCCGARSVVRRISIRENAIVLRCTACASLRIEPFDAPAPPPRLRLIVSR